MAFIIIFLDVYWLYRAIKTVGLSIVGYRRMRRAVATDWMAKLRSDLSGKWEDWQHVFIIPTYKERGYVIETTMAAIAASEYSLDKVRVILAMEQRDDEEVKAEKRAVAEKYRDVLGGVYVTEHPPDLEGEVVGPGSNRTWALKQLLPELQKELDPARTILTTLDADFAIHPRLLPAMMYKYLTTPKPERKSFTGVFFYSNNYWQAPTPMRIISLSLTVSQMGELVESWKYVNFSSHSINLQTLVDLNFWTIDHVNDDSHLYWKAFYQFKGDYEVVPHWMPINADAVLDETFRKTLVNQYKQLQRWAYGAEHMPYIVKQSVLARGVPLLSRLERLLYITRAYLFWATIAFVTGFGALITLALNREFQQTVLGQNLAVYSSLILTIAILGLVPMILYGKLLTPPMPETWGPWKRVWGRAQVVLSPLVLMTFGTLPAIDAQTRLMLGKYLAFRVTRKHREPGSSTRQKNA